MKIIDEGKYPEKNKMKCEECGCEFQYYNTEVITDMTTPDEEAMFGGFGVHKYLKCPTCKTICTISCDFKEREPMLSKIKKWWDNLFYASTE